MTDIIESATTGNRTEELAVPFSDEMRNDEENERKSLISSR